LALMESAVSGPGSGAICTAAATNGFTVTSLTPAGDPAADERTK